MTLHAASLAYLRERLGYDGVIVFYCLELNAIWTECGGTVEGAVPGLRSGCDSLVTCHTLELQTSALQNVCRAVKHSRIRLHQTQESAERMRKLTSSCATDSVHFAASIGVLVGVFRHIYLAPSATGHTPLLLVDERQQKQGWGSALLRQDRRHLTYSPNVNNCTEHPLPLFNCSPTSP